MASKLYYSIPPDHILSRTIPILASDNIPLMFCTMVDIRVAVFYLEDPVYAIESLENYSEIQIYVRKFLNL